MTTTTDPQTVAQVLELARFVEAGDMDGADSLLQRISREREVSLFRELGKLTREFHEALQTFRNDTRITDITEEEIPNARVRLRHVVNMTAQAADRSLTAAEGGIAICHGMQEQIDTLGSEWNRFTQRQMSADEFRAFACTMTAYFAENSQTIPMLASGLQDIIMAQDFQDLTGQVIGQVIVLVDDVEQRMVEMIRLSGMAGLSQSPPSLAQGAGVSGIEAHGPMVPGVDDSFDVVSGQDEVDDLLSSLGF